MKISAETAIYIMKLDSQFRGFPLNEDELKFQINHVRKFTGKYSMMNGDLIVYKNKHWSIQSFKSYKESIRQRS